MQMRVHFEISPQIVAVRGRKIHLQLNCDDTLPASQSVSPGLGPPQLMFFFCSRWADGPALMHKPISYLPCQNSNLIVNQLSMNFFVFSMFKFAKIVHCFCLAASDEILYIFLYTE